MSSVTAEHEGRSREKGLRVPRAGCTVRCMTVVLNIAAEGERPELCVRPWLAVDMPDFLAAMTREGPEGGPRSHPDVDGPGPRNWSA